MSDQLLNGGPDNYWSTSEPPSRGQWKDIALAALDLLGIPEPVNRFEATTAMCRLRMAAGMEIPEVPEL